MWFEKHLEVIHGRQGTNKKTQGEHATTGETENTKDILFSAHTFLLNDHLRHRPKMKMYLSAVNRKLLVFPLEKTGGSESRSHKDNTQVIDLRWGAVGNLKEGY